VKPKVPEEKVLSITLLGSPEVSFEGRGPQFERKKAFALLPTAIPSAAASTASRS
jgi:hypothetical protein